MKNKFDYYYETKTSDIVFLPLEYINIANERTNFKHRTYINIAKEMSKLSYAKRKKVGAILVKNDCIIAEGYNGTPHGFDNNCEILESKGHEAVGSMTTKPEVLHAESNAIAKIAKSTQSSEGSILYVTLSPCFECSKLIIQAGIKEVFYEEEYRDTSGIELLKSANIKVNRL